LSHLLAINIFSVYYCKYYLYFSRQKPLQWCSIYYTNSSTSRVRYGGVVLCSGGQLAAAVDDY